MGTLAKNMFSEGGHKLTFPDSNCFLFAALASYKELSWYGFCECDVAWVDIENKYIYLIEFKNYTRSTTTMQGRLQKSVKKVNSCLMMLNTLILNNNFGKDLGSSLGFSLTITPAWNMAAFCIYEGLSKSDANIYNDVFNMVINGTFASNREATIQPYKQLFQLQEAFILDLDTAKTRLKSLDIILS
jgi:hypothetical protein